MVTALLILLALTTTALGKSPCKNKYETLPHPEECQLYYDCSRPTSDLPRVTEANLFECDYPFLFDENYGACRNYSMGVKCGSRKIRFDICDTLRFRNAHAHGRPCHIDHLDCEGLGNGRQPIPHMLYSPYYAICQDGRFFGKEQCEKNAYFDPNLTDCVQRDDN